MHIIHTKWLNSIKWLTRFYWLLLNIKCTKIIKRVLYFQFLFLTNPNYDLDWNEGQIISMYKQIFNSLLTFASPQQTHICITSFRIVISFSTYSVLISKILFPILVSPIRDIRSFSLLYIIGSVYFSFILNILCKDICRWIIREVALVNFFLEQHQLTTYSVIYGACNKKTLLHYLSLLGLSGLNPIFSVLIHIEGTWVKTRLRDTQ